MKNIDEFGFKLCKFQAELFKSSSENADCSSPIFLRRFMYSSVAERMDKNCFLFEAADVNTILDDIEAEFGKSNYGTKKYQSEELYWMGYLYRYWCYTHEKTSKQVYKIIKPEELKGLYFPYHSLDPAQAIERILEAKGLGEKDFTQKGVEILRKLLKSKCEGEQI